MNIGTIGASKRIPELDGLRGAAIFVVLAYHYVDLQAPTDRIGLRFYAEHLFLLGWSGVDLFFVLSGFLIGGILLDVRNSPSYFKTFYIRRFFRIIPIYYAWILIYIFLVIFASETILAHSNSGVITKPNFLIYGHFLFLQNLAVPSFVGLAVVWFAPLWSLAVEEQFYLISPLVVRLFSTRNLKIFLISVIAGAPLLRMTLLRVVHVSPSLPYGLMPCRADSLAMGMLAVLLWRTRGFRERLLNSGTAVYGVLMLLLGGVGLLWKWSPAANSWGAESVGFTWLAFFYALILLLALSRPEGPVARLARMAWLREVGRVSYCMYIIHLAVLSILHSLLRHAPPTISDWRGAVVAVLAGLATYGIAWLSWEFFEGPLQRLGHAFKY